MKNTYPNLIAFDEGRLSNGVKTYHLQRDIAFSVVYIIVPVGTAHNTNTILPGMFHFLEHICCKRSKHNPIKNSFIQSLGLLGGWSNAHTQAFSTTYELTIPNAYLEEGLAGLFSRTFEPLLLTEDIEVERTIVSNERNAERWYPRSSEKSHYLSTQWQDDTNYPIEQLYGSDANLAAMDRDALLAAHRYYFSHGVSIISVGPQPPTTLYNQTAELSLTEHSLATAYNPITWVDNSYCEVPIEDMGRHELTIGSFTQPGAGIDTYRNISFIVDMLCTSIHGPLYEWLRNETGWVYGIDFDSSYNSAHQTDWTISIPLNSLDEVAAVRAQINDRMFAALTNKDLINAEVDRRLANTVYWNEQAEGIVDTAAYQLGAYGTVLKDQAVIDSIEACRDQSLLMRTFEEYFIGENVGSICFIPK